MNTLLLDISAWDLVRDASGNIAMASEPYSLAQDAASAIKTFLGECYLDKTLGLPYLTQIFGRRPSLPLLKAQLVGAAMTVPDVASARVFLSDLSHRGLAGQVQTTSKKTGEVSVAPFSVSPFAQGRAL